MTNTAPTPFGACLTRFQAGDPDARNELLRLIENRLLAMTRRMMARFPCLWGRVQSQSVVQDVMIRMDRCLTQLTITSRVEYLRLAAEQIRRELTDRARRFKTKGTVKNPVTLNGWQDSDPLHEVPEADQEDHALLDLIVELHNQVVNLPPKLRDVVNFHYYLGMTQPEVAKELGISEKTVRRRLAEAKLLLKERLERPNQD